MLYGVGIGLRKEHLTLKAIEVIKNVDEVIVPGKMARDIISDIRSPRVVEFPMGRSKEVAKKLGMEFAERCSEEDIAFCCIGDPLFYSTFHHVVNEALKFNPELDIEIIPGVSSVSAALAKAKIFINGSLLVTTQDFYDVNVAVVLKAKKPRKIAEKLKGERFRDFILIEKMFSADEKIWKNLPKEASYFSVLIGLK